MKKYFNNKHLNKVLLVIIGICLFAGGGVVALTLYADDIIYNPANSEFKVSDAQGALDQLYNMAGQCESVDETIVLYFGGREILANEKQFGSQGGVWMSCAVHTANGLVVENINPRIFSQVRYESYFAVGSSSGDYPDQSNWTGHFNVNFVDRVTGEIVKTTGSGNIVVDLSDLENPVDMYVDATIRNCSYGDPWAACWLKNTYLKVRDDYEG